MYPYYNQVERAHNELIREGKIKDTNIQSEVENQKGLLTRRSAYYSHLVDSNIGILEKTVGNNSMGYSVDLIIHKDGRYWDIVTDNGSRPILIVGGIENSDLGLVSRWRQPTKELADIVDNFPEPIPDPIPTPLPDLDQQLKRLEQEIHHLKQLVQMVISAVSNLRFPDYYLDLFGSKLPIKKNGG